MTDPTLPTYGAVRAAYVTGRDRMYRRHTRHIPTDAQRAQWRAEFDRWANAIRAEAWNEGALAAIDHAFAASHPPFGPIPDNPTNPYRED